MLTEAKGKQTTYIVTASAFIAVFVIIIITVSLANLLAIFDGTCDICNAVFYF